MPLANAKNASKKRANPLLSVTCVSLLRFLFALILGCQARNERRKQAVFIILKQALATGATSTANFFTLA